MFAAGRGWNWESSSSETGLWVPAGSTLHVGSQRHGGERARFCGVRAGKPGGRAASAGRNHTPCAGCPVSASAGTSPCWRMLSEERCVLLGCLANLPAPKTSVHSQERGKGNFHRGLSIPARETSVKSGEEYSKEQSWAKEAKETRSRSKGKALLVRLACLWEQLPEGSRPDSKSCCCGWRQSLGYSGLGRSRGGLPGSLSESLAFAVQETRGEQGSALAPSAVILCSGEAAASHPRRSRHCSGHLLQLQRCASLGMTLECLVPGVPDQCDQHAL